MFTENPGAGGSRKIQMVGDRGCRRQALFGRDLNKVSKNGTIRKIGLPTRCLLLLKHVGLSWCGAGRTLVLGKKLFPLGVAWSVMSKRLAGGGPLGIVGKGLRV